MWVELWRGWWHAARRRPFRLGFSLGLVTGMALAAVLSGYVQPLPADDLEHGELVILSGKDESTGGQRQVLIEQWNKLHPHSPARIEELSAIADAQHSEMVARAQSGRDDVDVYNLDVTWTAEFAEAGYIRPLDESYLDTSGFLEAPLKTCRYKGKLWALPFNTDAGLLFYRADLVGKPTNWQQLVQFAKDALAKAQQNGEQHGSRPQLGGYVTQLADYEGLTVNALEAIWAAGGTVVDSDGNLVLDSNFDRAVEAGLKLLAAGLGPDGIIMPESRRNHEEESLQTFEEKKALFMRNWPVAYRDLPAEELAPPHPTFGVTTLPGPSALGGQNLAVARHTRKPRAAQALVEFLTSARSQQILFERGGLAATQEVVYHDPEVISRYPYATTLLGAIQNAQPRPITPHYSRFSEVFRAGVLEALQHNGKPPEDFAAQLAAAVKGH